MTHFDLIIVGTGSGNSILGPEYDDCNVAIVERGVFGGTCLNVGCIPSKMFVLPADRMVEAQEANDRLDVEIEPRGVDWPSLRDRVFGRIDAIVDGGTSYREGQEHVTVFHGDAKFIGERRLSVTASDGSVEEITADQIVLAAGARPVVPDIEGLADVPFHTSDTIMRIEELPERLMILGGGFIAAEMGHVFSALGVAVTVVHRGDRMLRHTDTEVSERFTEEFAQRVDLRLNTTTCCVRSCDGRIVAEIVDAADAHAAPGDPSHEVVSFDMLLVTTGRQPNGAQMCAEAGGVELDSYGYVITDDQLRTSAEGVWALGDIRNPLQLKHLANLESKVVAHNLLNPGSLHSIDERVVPHAVFSHPQIGSVGATESALVADGVEFVVGRRDYAAVAFGWALADTTGFAKILLDPFDLTILGAHILGPQSATLIQQVVQAMALGVTAEQMAHSQIWCHPALPELLENALLDGLDAAAAYQANRQN